MGIKRPEPLGQDCGRRLDAVAASQGKEIRALELGEMLGIVVKFRDDQKAVRQQSAQQPQVMGAGDDHSLLDKDLPLAGPGST